MLAFLFCLLAGAGFFPWPALPASQQGEAQTSEGQDAAADQGTSLEKVRRELAQLGTSGSAAQRMVLLLRLVDELMNEEQYNDALAAIEQLLQVADALGDRQVQGLAFNRQGEALLALGSYEEARAAFDAAFGLHEFVGPDTDRANTFLGRGNAHEYLGAYAKAREDYQRALELHQGKNDASGIARARNNMGNVYGKLGMYDEALSQYELSLQAKRSLGDPAGIGTALNNIGNIYSKMNQPERALEFYEEAIVALRKAGRKLYIEILLGNIGAMHRRLGNYDKARENLERSVEMAQAIEDLQGVAIGYHNLAQVFGDTGDLDAAERTYLKALEIERRIGDKQSTGETLNNLASIYLKMDRVEEGLVLCDESRAIAEDLADNYMLETHFQNRANLLARKGDFRSAFEALQKFKELGDARLNTHSAETLARLKSRLDFDKETLAREKEILELKHSQAEQALVIENERYYRYMLTIGALLLVVFLGFSASMLRRERRYAKRLRQLSLQDPLTRLGNRRSLSIALATAVPEVNRHYFHGTAVGRPENRDLIFYLIDLDHFKQVNDVHGHAAGDLVLSEMRKILKPLMRETDLLVRWGGEEFLFVARNADRSHAMEIAERIRDGVAVHPFKIGKDKVLQVSCSIGFACYPFFQDKPEAVGWEQTVTIADKVLYLSKEHGRNAWTGALAMPGWYQDSPDLYLGEHLAQALENKEIQLVKSWH